MQTRATRRTIFFRCVCLYQLCSVLFLVKKNTDSPTNQKFDSSAINCTFVQVKPDLVWPVASGSDSKLSFVSITRWHGNNNIKSRVTEVHQSSWAESVDSHAEINCLLHDLTLRLSGEQNDGSPFLVLLCWEVVSPAYIVTDAYVATGAAHADIVGWSWPLPDNSANRSSDKSESCSLNITSESHNHSFKSTLRKTYIHLHHITGTGNVM